MMKATRWVLGYDECGGCWLYQERERWDYVHGQGWVRSWAWTGLKKSL